MMAAAAASTRPTPVRFTAATVVNTGQLIFFAVLVVATVVATILSPLIAAKVAVALVLIFFAVFVGLLKMGVWIASTRYRYPDYTVPDVSDAELPFYAVFVPMYQEAAMVAPMVRGMAELAYPRDKLRVMLLVETRERDPETRAAIDEVEL